MALSMTKTVAVVLALTFAALVPPGATAQPLLESSNPMSGNAEAIVEGQKLYLTNCVGCHGIKTDGKTRWPAADLRVFNKGYSRFLGIVSDGRSGPLGSMPSWSKVLSKPQISAIGAYIEQYALPDKAVWKDHQ